MSRTKRAVCASNKAENTDTDFLAEQHSSHMWFVYPCLGGWSGRSAKCSKLA